jgi:hypothetical protein
MPTNPDDQEERAARIDRMIDDYREARQRQLVKRGIALWKRAEAAHFAQWCAEHTLPEKVH